MDEVLGARTFGVAADSYDGFMGRYSGQLAPRYVEAVGVRRGDTVVEVGCGPGALTHHLVDLLGPDAVFACDPSPRFVEACAERHPGVRVEQGRAESIPFAAACADHAMAQLVMHFVSAPEEAAHEMVRVVRPGGTVSACVWDFEGGMEMLREFWAAAESVDPEAEDEASRLRFGRPGELVELFTGAGTVDLVESTLHVASTYESFDELWSGFMAGVGPAGSYCVGLDVDGQERLRRAVSARLGNPTAPFTLDAVARCAVGRVPSP